MEYWRAYKLVTITTLVSAVMLLLIYGWYNFKVSDRSFEVGDFNKVYAGGLMTVYLKQGKETSVSVRADDFMIDKVRVEVIDGELRIYNDDGISGERVTDAYVTYTSLHQITANNAATIISQDEIQTNTLSIQSLGSSETKIRLRCDTLKLDMKGVANVQLAGDAHFFQFSIHDLGDLMAYHFKTKNCDVEMHTGDQSPGIARINVSDTLSASIKGPRYIYYIGSPIIKKESIIGTGRLIQK